MITHSIKSVLFLITVSVLLATSCAQAGLKIYYIRHAEGGHNVKNDWAHVPKAEWPVYVGNDAMFTPKGEAQQAAVAGKLKNLHFDFIAVSPMWRTRNTILPYLKETETKAEIWPELHELEASTLILSPDLVPPAVPILGAGSPVEIPSEEAPWFSLREDGKNKFKMPPFEKDQAGKEEEAAAARLVIQSVIDLIHQRFGGSNKSILLVGHGSSGKGLLRMLTKNELKGFSDGLANTGIWMVEEQPDGEFELKIYNDVPVESGTRAAPAE